MRISDAQAAYHRVVNLNAIDGDALLLRDAARQKGMPAEIVTLGNAIATLLMTYQAYTQAHTPKNAHAYEVAIAAVQALVNAPEDAVMA
jgi:hypothetical protein